MKKILKQMYLNLFMQHLLSLVTQDSCTSKKEGFGHDWYQNTWKRFEKICMKIKYSIHQCKGFWIQISTLIRSHTYTDQNLMPRTCKLRPRLENNFGIFVKKIEN